MMTVACGRPSRSARNTPVRLKPWLSLGNPASTKSGFSRSIEIASGFVAPQRIKRVRPVFGDVHSAVCALGQRFLNRLLHAFRPYRHDYDFSGVFFFQAQCFLVGITIRLIHFKPNSGFTDPASIGNW
jgi:hypothetical protein